MTRRAAPVAICAGAAVLAAATAGALTGTEPFATWYYLLAWYPTLLMLDAAVALRGGRFFLLGRPAFLLSLMAWSVPFWLLFELYNFRLENWYYVFVPAERAPRWAGILLSFATVLPAIFVAERLLDAQGFPGRHRKSGSPIARLTAGRLAALQAAGFLMLLLPLVWPRFFFPFVWGGVTLVADPWVYRRDPSRSLLGDLERGAPGRPLRLLVGGMAIGLLWELFNAAARSRWIYTVPWLEDLKLFEMPLLGFFGFPVFALEGFAAYQALVIAGLAVSQNGAARAAPKTFRGTAAALACVFALLVLLGMERETISSTTPRLAELPGVPATILDRAGYDAFELAEAAPAVLAASLDADPRRARAWVATARLATLRGIGTDNVRRLRATGIATVEELAAADPRALSRRLEADSRDPAPPARVRVWVRAAR